MQTIKDKKRQCEQPVWRLKIRIEEKTWLTKQTYRLKSSATQHLVEADYHHVKPTKEGIWVTWIFNMLRLNINFLSFFL